MKGSGTNAGFFGFFLRQASDAFASRQEAMEYVVDVHY